MGLISAIAKYAPRALKLVPDMVLGTSAEAFGKGFKAAKGSIFKDRLKAGAKAIEADVAEKTAKNGNFFRRLYKDIKDFFPGLWKSGKNGAKNSKILNEQLKDKVGEQMAKHFAKGSISGALKGIGKFLLKKMPLINSIAICVMSGPGIYRKFKNEGFTAGMLESLGVSAEIGLAAIGTAIGTALPIPGGAFIGGLAGYFIGEWIKGKISPEKAETAQNDAQYSTEPLTENDIETLRKMNIDDEDIKFALEKKMSMQDVVNIINEQKKKAEEQAATQSATTQEAQGSDALTSQTQTQKYDPDIEKVINTLNRNYAQTSPMSFYSYNTPSNTYSNDMYYSKLNMGGSNPFSYNMMFNPMMMGLPYMNTSNPFMPQIPYYNMFYSA